MEPNPLAQFVNPMLLARKQHHRSLMASSYDRRGGNHDWSNYVRKEGDAAVMMIAEGPGIITRIWTADPQQGIVRVFIDNEARPAIECRFEDLFTQLPLTSGIGGENEANYARSKAERVPMGYTTYSPLIFDKRCQITIDPEDNYLYYHLNYNQYPVGMLIDANEIQKTTQQAERLLAEWQQGKDRYKDAGYATKSLSVKAGQTYEWDLIAGSSVIKSIRIRLPKIERKDIERHLKENLWLVIHFDDDEPRDPSVRAPIGPLFMDYDQADRPRSLFVGTDLDGEYYLEFPMPFISQASIKIVNKGIVDVEGLEIKILTEGFDRDDAEYQRFKSTWHIEMPFGPDHRDYNGVACRLLNLDGRDNYEILNVRGGGHFVGCGFQIDLREAPTDRAAGEGDEMFFIDDDPRFTLYGTGTEDYVNDAWGVRGYVGPFAGSSLSGDWGVDPQIFGYRLHVSDCVPFVRHGRFTLEHGTGNNCSGLYRSVAYWYADQAIHNTKREERHWEAIGKST